jgi:hypothetical protein
MPMEGGKHPVRSASMASMSLEHYIEEMARFSIPADIAEKIHRGEAILKEERDAKGNLVYVSVTDKEGNEYFHFEYTQKLPRLKGKSKK